jgi:hypothetical protein
MNAFSNPHLRKVRSSMECSGKPKQATTVYRRREDSMHEPEGSSLDFSSSITRVQAALKIPDEEEKGSSVSWP